MFLFNLCMSSGPNYVKTDILQDLSLTVMGILNDATGTLMSCAHKNPNCRIGIIIGELMMITALY